MTATAAGIRRPARVLHPGPVGVRAAAGAAPASRGPGAAGPAGGSRGRGPRCDSRRSPRPVRCALPPWHRGCRAPARRIHGRRVRYHIGSVPGQINGMRWQAGPAR
ncbi:MULTISPECIES: tryptophan biosynthesis modulator TrpM [unclassified Streptomyces]|uniref:tryptophan biosynthesis modulator TrpM n=1 Tax=unclassified Streptomyces TaxID=2593676 RepID=UPI0037F1188C